MAAVLVVAERKVTGEVEGPGGWMDAAKGSGLVLGSGKVLTDVESRGVVGGDGLRQA